MQLMKGGGGDVDGQLRRSTNGLGDIDYQL